jgi:hypothetical protein
MSILTTIFFSGIGVIVALIVVIHVTRRSSYKYPCWIAIPTGDNPDDVVFVSDKFKERRMKGHTQIMFLNNRGKAYSPKYTLWSKFLRKGKELPNIPEGDDQWAIIDDGDLRKHLLRGAFFYKVSDREYKVLKVSREMNFKVVDHDSTELIIDDIERENEITNSFKDKLIALGMWLGSLIIIGLIAIAIIVLTFKFSGDVTTAQSLAMAASQASSIVPAGVGA